MTRRRLTVFALLLSLVAPAGTASAQQVSDTGLADDVKVTIVSTMLADSGIGEWGFAAVVEVDGRRWLFDTGARPETVLRNAEEMKIDLASITDVILSHHHADHTGGLLTLRKALMATSASALSVAHVASGMFRSRRTRGEAEANPMIALRAAYEATGGRVVEYDGSRPLQRGVWLSGPVPRPYKERNWSGSTRIQEGASFVDDTLPEDQALFVSTPRGVTIVTGCGHAGIGNILAYAQATRAARVRAVVGGLHLLAADETQLVWTAERMRAAGVAYLLGAHCTGIEAVFRLRALVGLTRATAVVGAVGSSYDEVSGLRPGLIAR